ncbi:MAG: type III PLP-dependent enzyme [Acidimicrobiales bacterium]
MTQTAPAPVTGLSDPVARFVDGNPDLTTPYLVVDLDMVEASYTALCDTLPGVRMLYAVKANPAHEVLRRLIAMGSSFDVASPGEIERCLGLGADPAMLSFGNTVKRERDIAFAFDCGIRTFAVDADAELDKIVRQAPGSTVYVRISTDGAGAHWPLSRKFGCEPHDAVTLLRHAAHAGLAVGVSFHVGSQQHDVGAWDAPLMRCAELAETLYHEGIDLAGVNLGGGFPSHYRQPAPPLSSYGAGIRSALDKNLSGFGGEVLAEPGRYLVGDAGVIESEVVLVSRRPAEGGTRWVYLDVGIYNGLAEAVGEAIRYRIEAPGVLGPMEPVVLAGPSCDSTDIIYESAGYELPAGLAAGDRVRLHATGAYTASYSSVWFNGFDPLPAFFVSDRPS